MNRTIKLTLTAGFLVAVFVVVIIFARRLSENPELVEFIANFGYLGVTLTAIVAGLNTVVPLPAATFTPIFLEAGMTIPYIILFLALGTLIADFLGYVLGTVSREAIITKYPKTFDFITKVQRDHQKLVIPMVLLYAAFAPLPNEVILIPLALSGIKFRKLILPLVIGNIIHQAVIIYGVSELLSFFA